MRILYPFNPLNSREADEPYLEEYNTLKSAGIDCSLFDVDALKNNEFNPKPTLETGESVLYRGWMLNPENYKKLAALIEKKGATPVTDYYHYLKCHHITGWYALCRQFTPESVFFANDDELEKNLLSLSWDSYFIKDFVKSNTTERGSIARSPAEAIEIVKLIEQYRGEIEGGIAVRRVEDYVDNTESRHFIMRGKLYSPTTETPEILEAVMRLISAPFFSVDVIKRGDGEFRIVEIGDGQVSDRKSWGIKSFSEMLIENARP